MQGASLFEGGRHGSAPRFLPFDIAPLHHCCLGCIDIEVGYRFMCLIFLFYGVLGTIAACVDLGGSRDVWKDFGEFNSKGLAFSRLILHMFFTANQFVGLRAHWNRDARKADQYFWGWICYVCASFFVEAHHLSSISSDGNLFLESECNRCAPLFANVTEGSGCEDERVHQCASVSLSGYFTFWAYLSGVFWLVTDTSVNLYFSVVARSYWFHLQDDKMIALGQSVLGESVVGSGLTALEEEALGGGGGDVYVRMDDSRVDGSSE